MIHYANDGSPIGGRRQTSGSTSSLGGLSGLGGLLSGLSGKDWNYSVTQNSGTGAPTGTGTTPPPATNTVQPPPGFQTPAGHSVVAVGPTGIPTLRANGATNNTGSPSSQFDLKSYLQNLLGNGGMLGNYQQRLADILGRDH